MTTQEQLEKILEDWFIELEKKQTAEQMVEVKKKGLWEAECKSASFEEIKKGIASAILSAMRIDGEY